MNLKHFNEGSLTSIHFYDNSLNFEKDLEFKNIVFAGNGIYNVLKNEFAIIYDKLNIDYNNSNLNNIDGNTIFKLNLPKPSIKYFIQIVEMFKYIYGKIKSELTLNLYYHKPSRKFHLEIMEQDVSPGASNYKYGSMENNMSYIRYLQIHSHHSMSANFSDTDDKDERNAIMCFFGVIGKLNEDSDVFQVEKKFRLWTGIQFVEIGFMDIFDMQIPKSEIDNKNLIILNRIVDETLKRKEEEKDKPVSEILQNLRTGKIFESSIDHPNVDIDDDIEEYLSRGFVI